MRWLAGLITLVLAGCVTTGDVDTRAEASPDEAAQINYELGSQYLRQGKLKLARERLERAVRQNPKLPGPHMALALIYERTGDTTRADKAYRLALRVAPKDSNAQNTYAVFLCNRGRHEEGQEYFLKAAENPENRSAEVAYSNAGVCALAIPDMTAAELHFRKALQRNPRFGDALLQMASLSYQQQEQLRARAFIERFAAENKMTPEALLLGARIEQSNGNNEGLAEYAMQLRSRYPDSDESRQLDALLKGG